MNIIEIDKFNWSERRASFNNVSLFDDSDFIEMVSAIYETKVRYLAIENQAKTVCLSAFYIKGNQIVIPSNFISSAFLLDASLSEVSYVKLIDELHSYLKKKYKKIAFRLDTIIKDNRPFKWNGYASDLRYTYHIDLKLLNYADNVYRNLKKIDENKISAKELTNLDVVFSQHEADLIEYGFSLVQLKRTQHFFELCLAKGILKIFAVYEDTQLKGSSLVLIDDYQKTAYLSLLSKVDQGTEHHTFLYDYMFKQLYDLHYAKMDLCGANTKGISLFKSRFNPKLVSYFMNTYSYTHRLFNKIYMVLGKIQSHL